ncbi:caspase family protein [Paraburkholderia sp. SIMBA_050]
MKLIKLWLTVSMLSYCTAAPNAVAQDHAPKRIALLIGNWDYNLNSKFDASPQQDFAPDLRNPCKDTELIKRRLTENNFQIFDYCNLDKSKYDDAVSSFGSNISGLPKGSIVFVYYSGHGLQFHGRTFTVPVLFRIDRTHVNALSAQAQFMFFENNANDISHMLQQLTDDKNVALVIALDNCRDDPVDENVAYNEAVSIRTGPNTLVQYATTAGDRAPDNSKYALVMSDELAKGGDIGDIMARVGTRIWQLYDSGQRDSYAETNVGPAFIALRYTPLKAGAKSASATISSHLIREKKIVRNVYDGVSLDILWCEGDGEEARFQFASSLAQKLSMRAQEFGVGRIQIKPISVYTNEHGGYNVHRNLMRYDVEYPKERAMLIKIASSFPEGNFLPQRGVGVGGKPTPNYVSAFICGRVSQ